ncbi:hypothetical protein FKM82_005920 [Ascaphus truei]
MHILLLLQTPIPNSINLLVPGEPPAQAATARVRMCSLRTPICWCTCISIHCFTPKSQKNYISKHKNTTCCSPEIHISVILLVLGERFNSLKRFGIMR